MVKFWLPKEIQLVDNNQCKVRLEGTKNVSIAIKATCPDGPVKEGLKAIVLQMEIHSNVWNPRTGLPTIWVCKENISVDISLKEIDTLVFGTLLMKSTVVNMAGLELVRCVRIIFPKIPRSLNKFASFICRGFVREVLTKAYLLNKLFLCRKRCFCCFLNRHPCLLNSNFSWAIRFNQSQTQTSPFFSLNHN